MLHLDKFYRREQNNNITDIKTYILQSKTKINYLGFILSPHMNISKNSYQKMKDRKNKQKDNLYLCITL